MKKTFKALLILSLVIMSVCAFSLFSFAADDDDKWVGAWGTGSTSVSLEDYGNIRFIANNMSARTVVTPTASGTKIRVKFTNYYGASDLVITRATIARTAGVTSLDPDEATSKIDKSTLKNLSFDEGAPGFTLKPGEEIYSDPIKFDVDALENIAITFYVEGTTEISTMGLSGGTTYLGLNGDMTLTEEFGWTNLIDDDQVIDLLKAIAELAKININMPLAYKIVRVVPIVTNIDVLPEDNEGYSICVIGDSTVANEFPLYLGEAINATGTKNVGVVGKGIIGNMLCGDEESLASDIYGENLLKRFRRDVGKYSGVKYIFVKIGANDIMHPVCGENADIFKQPSADELIDAFKELCEIAHEEFDAKIIFSTITQWKGTKRDYFGDPLYDRTPAEENADWEIALEVNDWITDSANTYHDGYVDLAAISGPIDKETGKPNGYFNPEYSEDAIHPTRDLQKIWANNIPLGLFGVTNKVGNIKLDSSSKTVYVGDDASLKVTSVLPEDAENKNVHWESSNTSVATVEGTGENGHIGKITALNNGTTLIRCVSEDGYAVSSAVETVKTHVSEVQIPETATVYSRKTVKLNANVLPASASDKSVTWKSSDPELAEVDQNGVVSAYASGTVTITCSSVDGKKSDTCKVTVLRPTDVVSVKTNVTKKTIYKGSSYQLTGQAVPSDATFPQIQWKSSNKKVATVSSTGLVTAVKAGTAYIYCTSVDNPLAYSKITITVKVKAEGVKLNKSKLSVFETDTKALSATVLPSDATNKKVTWKSLDTKIAKVDSYGVVTGVKEGKTQIVCTTSDGGFTATCSVTVKELVESTKVKLNYKSKTIKDGKTVTLKATISPSDVSFKDCIWSSSNKKVAKVSSKGVVTGVNPGTCVITCKTKDTGKTAKCKITVKEVKPSSVELNRSKISIKPGETYTLKAEISPENTTNKKVTWKSSNTKVAKVNSKGKVTAVAPGTAKITCTTERGKKVDTCNITVKHIYPTSVTIRKSTVDLAMGSSTTLKVKIKPSNATYEKLTWKSSNTKVATVDKNGKVKAVGEGKTLITCKPAKGGGKGSSCVVTVTKIPVLGIKLNVTSLILNGAGKTYQLTGVVVPENATNKKVIWSTTDPNVATVNNKGRVTSKGPGTCYIRATAVDGGYVVTCKVIVN